jgi:GH25 family lysozyme M1 (1,4-beta-N-acetylmuramidase)
LPVLLSFNKKPNINKKWMFWQHSHKGKFDFADGWVDINTYNGNRAEWNKYLE